MNKIQLWTQEFSYFRRLSNISNPSYCPFSKRETFIPNKKDWKTFFNMPSFYWDECNFIVSFCCVHLIVIIHVHWSSASLSVETVSSYFTYNKNKIIMKIILNWRRCFRWCWLTCKLVLFIVFCGFLLHYLILPTVGKLLAPPLICSKSSPCQNVNVSFLPTKKAEIANCHFHKSKNHAILLLGEMNQFLLSSRKTQQRKFFHIRSFMWRKM